MKTKILSNKGQSLVQLMLVVGIMGIVMAGFVSMLQAQQTETRAMAEKFSAMDLERVLVSSLSSGSTCKYILNNPSELTFDSTKVIAGTPVRITPSLPLYANVTAGAPGPIVAEVGKSASAYSNSLLVKSISLMITSGVGNSYSGHWEVGFDPAKTVRALKPIRISTLLTADTTNPTESKITNCMGQAGGSVNFNDCRVVKASGVTNGSNGVVAMCSADEAIISGTCVFSSVQNSYYVDSAGKNINYDPAANASDPKGYGCGWNPGVSTSVSAICCKKSL